MSEPRKESAAVVILMFLDGTTDGTSTADEDIQIEGTGVSWVCEDMTIARNLKDQLGVLLGAPVADCLWPSIPFLELKKAKSSWPGTVVMEREKPA